MASSPLDNKLVLGICGFLPVLPVLPVLLIWKISPGHSSPAATGRVVWKRIIFDAPWYWTSTLAEGKGAWLIMSPKGKQTSGHVAGIGQHAKNTACIVKFGYYWTRDLHHILHQTPVQYGFQYGFHGFSIVSQTITSSRPQSTCCKWAEGLWHLHPASHRNGGWKGSQWPSETFQSPPLQSHLCRSLKPKDHDVSMMFQWLIGSVCRIHAADRSYFEVYKEDSKERVDLHGPKELQDVWRNSISWFEFAASICQWLRFCSFHFFPLSASKRLSDRIWRSCLCQDGNFLVSFTAASMTKAIEWIENWDGL